MIIQDVDYYVNLSGIEDVTKSRAPTAAWEQQAGPTPLGDVLKASVSNVAVQDFLAFVFLRLRKSPTQTRRIDRTSHDKNIELTVIVEINEGCPPLDRGGLPAQASLECTI